MDNKHGQHQLEMVKAHLIKGTWNKNVRKGTSKGIRNSEASEYNRKTILRFIRERELTMPSLSCLTNYTYTVALHSLSEFLKKKKFSDAIKDDMFEYLSKMKERGLKENTYKFQMSMIKVFYKWLNGCKSYPESVEWVRLKGEANKLKPEDLLKPEEIKQILSATENLRDKAVIALMSEAPVRIGELSTIKLKDIKFDEYGIFVKVDGKTGTRAQRIVDSVPYLREYLKTHPAIKDKVSVFYKEDNFTNGQEKGKLIIDREDNSYLFFITRHSTSCEKDANRKWLCKRKHHTDVPFSPQSITMMLRRLVEKVGIKKHIHPHLFRHTAITELAKKLPTPILNSYAGWSQNSNMARTYIHLSDTSVDDAILRSKYNFEINRLEKTVNSIEFKICLNCKERNMSEVSYCVRCNSPLDKEEFENLAIRNQAVISGLFPMSAEVFQKVVEQEVRRAIDKLMEIRAR